MEEYTPEEKDFLNALMDSMDEDFDGPCPVCGSIKGDQDDDETDDQDDDETDA